jgi:Asp-tRNA(Asn)/Glu-tRNA(Gln) amidotransferase A subunit family amidase
LKKWQKLLASDRAVSKQRLQQLAAKDGPSSPKTVTAINPGPTERGSGGPLAGMSFSVEDTMDVRGVPTRCGVSFEGLFEDPAEVSDAWVEALSGAGCCFSGKLKSPPFGHGLLREEDDSAVEEPVTAPICVGMDTYGRFRCDGVKRGHFVFRAAGGRFAGGLPIAPSMDAPAVSAASLEDLKRVLAVLGFTDAAAGSYPVHAESHAHERKRVLLVEYPDNPLPVGIKQSIVSCYAHWDWQSPIATLAPGARVLQKSTEAFATLVAREAHFIHYHWLEEYGSAYPQELLNVLQRGRKLSPQRVASARDVQRKVRQLLLQWLGQWDCVALPLSLPMQGKMADSPAGNVVSAQLAPIQLAGLPAFTIPLAVAGDTAIALQLLLRPDAEDWSDYIG